MVDIGKGISASFVSLISFIVVGVLGYHAFMAGWPVWWDLVSNE